MSAKGPCDKCGKPGILAPHTGRRLCDACFMALFTPPAEPDKRAIQVGDPVLYHPGNGGDTVFAVVTKVAEHDGDVDLDLGEGVPQAVDVKMGQGPHTFEPLDFTPDWTIVYCPGCGHRNPSYFDACFACGTPLASGEIQTGGQQ